MPKIKFVDLATGEEIEREMNKEELAQLEIDIAETETKRKAEKQKALLKAEILERLGMTEDEAKLLFS